MAFSNGPDPDRRAAHLQRQIDELRNQLELVENWKLRGEQLAVGRSPGVAFWLGEWWADRPWRVRP